MTITEKPAVIRLPPTTQERRRAYMRAAGAKKMKLTDWIWETLDRQAEAEKRREAGL